MTERRWRVRVLFTFRGRPKTPITDAAPGTLAISTQLRRSCRPVWANDALDHACDSRAAGCPDEEWEQDATMKATLHERDADHDELLRRVQVQPDDVADQRRPQALEFLRRDRSVPGIQPYLVQNLGIHWTPSGPATDPGLVDDRGRRVNAPVSPAHPQEESRAVRCAEQRRVSAWTPARTCARWPQRRPDAGGRSWFRGPGSSRATGRSSPAAGPGRTAR